jgi:hypothetical protein
MTVEQIDAITFWVWAGQWPVWLLWEMVLLWLRRKGGPRSALTGRPARTISMVPLRYGWKLTGLVYLNGGLATHFFVPSPQWGSTLGGIAFWGLAAALLAWDWRSWELHPRFYPRWARWARFPGFWLLLGALAGWGLFPQQGALPWSSDESFEAAFPGEQ